MVGAVGAVPGQGAEAPTHTLFMGSDFSIEWKGGLRPVEAVEGKSFVVKVDNHRDTVPVSRTDLKIKIEDQLKLARQSATIEHFKADRAYTPANDPRIKGERAIAVAMSAEGASDLAAGQMVTAESAANGAAASAASAAASGSLDASGLAANAATLAAASAASSASYQQSLASSAREIDSVPTLISNIDSELMRKEFDALELTFDLSAPEPHDSPYMIVVARFREKTDPTNTDRLWVYAETLPRIDAKPRKIRLFRGGFDPGYELKDCRVHLFDGGSEIATNISRKRVPLSTAEAFQYSVIDYTLQHRDQTVAPTPALAFWPADWQTRLASEQRRHVVFVQVGKDGKAVGVFEDKDCTTAANDATIVAALPNLRFYPAVAKGKPVAGILALKLGSAVQ